MWVGPRLELEHVWLDTGTGPVAGPRTWHEWDVGGAVLAGYSVRLDEGFTVQAALGLGALYRPALPGFRPWTVTVAPRAQLSLGWSFRGSIQAPTACGPVRCPGERIPPCLP
jgi:hypothetical protein